MQGRRPQLQPRTSVRRSTRPLRSHAIAHTTARSRPQPQVVTSGRTALRTGTASNEVPHGPRQDAATENGPALPDNMPEHGERSTMQIAAVATHPMWPQAAALVDAIAQNNRLPNSTRDLLYLMRDEVIWDLRREACASSSAIFSRNDPTHFSTSLHTALLRCLQDQTRRVDHTAPVVHDRDSERRLAAAFQMGATLIAEASEEPADYSDR